MQSLISALPEADSITADNLESVKGDLAAIEAAKAELDETQQAALNMEKYNAAMERVAVVEGELEAERIESEQAAQESQQKIDNVQSLISALPEADSITEENLEDVKAQLAAIEAAKAELDETQQSALNMEKYNAAVERIAAIEENTQEAGNEPTENDVASVTIDGVTTYYEDLGAAITAASNKTAVITLLKDITSSNVNGFSIYGNVTFKGNHTVDPTYMPIQCYGSVTIEEGNYKNISFYSMGGIVEIAGGTLERVDAMGGTVIIKEGTIDASSCLDGSITVTGGTIEMLTGYKGNITIKQGTINKLYPKGGSIDIMGGTINSLFGSEGISYKPESVALDKKNLSLKVKEQKTLTATVTPNISAPGFPVWESSDEAVATVSNGTVTAVGAGTADITVTAGNKSQTCKVTVGAVASVTIDGQTQDYTDLDDAAAAVSGTGGKLTLLKDVSGRTQPLELSGPMTFDLGGHTLSGAWEDDPYGGLLEITSGVVEVKNGNVSVPGDTGVLCCAIAVREGATLSGNATYSANSWGNVVYNKGTIQEGNFYGECTLYGTVQGGNFYITSLNVVGRIEGGIFNNTRPGALGVTFGIGGVILGGTFNNTNIICTSNSLFQGGTFNNCGFYVISDYFVSGEMILASGYVAYDTSGKIVIDRQPQIGLTTMNFTGTIEPHKSHTYDFTNSEDGNGNYTCSETTCPICGITAPEGAAYTVTIPKTAQLGSDTEVSVNNSLSQEKTVTVSMNETQVTLTRENDPEQTQIVSDVTFEDISVTKGQKDTEKVTFDPPVYNNDPNAVIPAGTYKGTLTFTIGMQ